MKGYRMTEYAADSFIKQLLPYIKRYFEEPEVKEKYEAWHMEKYGCTPDERQAQLIREGYYDE